MRVPGEPLAEVPPRLIGSPLRDSEESVVRRHDKFKSGYRSTEVGLIRSIERNGRVARRRCSAWPNKKENISSGGSKRVVTIGPYTMMERPSGRIMGYVRGINYTMRGPSEKSRPATWSVAPCLQIYLSPVTDAARLNGDAAGARVSGESGAPRVHENDVPEERSGTW
ncbi:hypothetical protein KM043_017271 [Ampulex compressa]|nr:hypothetical protein KM043_017271 [Ampulex compressa]